METRVRQHRKSRRAALIAASALTVGSMALIPAHAAPRGAVCALSGSATISPGLGATAKTQSVTFSAIKLSSCLMGNAGSPGVPKFVSGTAVVSPSPATTKASCASGSLKGLTATLSWASGSATVAFTTTSVTGETVISGKVLSSSNPNLKAGDLVEGDAVFKPSKTSMNCATVPVTAVTFNGAIGSGSPKG